MEKRIEVICTGKRQTEMFKDISTKPAGCKEECHYNLRMRVVVICTLKSSVTTYPTIKRLITYYIRAPGRKATVAMYV